MKFCSVFLLLGSALLVVANPGVVDNRLSPHATIQSVGLHEVQWTGGFWADRFRNCRERMVPNMWRLAFAQIATPTATTFNDTGRAPNTTYRYRVRARDAVPNYSEYSSVVSPATPPDTQAPSVPANLAGTPVSGAQINLSWTASTDDVAVTGYRVERCQGSGCATFAEIGAPATNSYGSTGLTTVTTYRYRVRAHDAVGNNSAYSSIVTVTTLDSQAPTTPGGITITATPNQLALSWPASTDNVGVTAYLIERCATANCTYAEIASVSATSYVDTSVAAITSYSYRVRARDAAGNVSGYSTVGSAFSADCD